MTDWQPIETAPKDGRTVWIVDYDDYVVRAKWRMIGGKARWREVGRGGRICFPKHWQAVQPAFSPEPPVSA